MSKLGKGTKFYRIQEDYSWNEIAYLTNINGPTGSRDVVDATTMDADKYKKIIGGLRDGGNFTFTLHYHLTEEVGKDDCSDIFADYEDDDKKWYKIVFPGSLGEFIFSGYVTECPIESSPEEIITQNVTIAIDGSPDQEQPTA